MSIFQKKDRLQVLIEESIKDAVKMECVRLEDEACDTDPEESELRCKNIKALAEAYAAINGWC